MVKDSILKMSSTVLRETERLNENVNNGYIGEAYNNYKNLIELYLHLESELPRNHSILKNTKKVLSSFKPIVEKYMKNDTEVISMISEATKAEKEAKKAEETAKREAMKKSKELKETLKEDYKTIKGILDGINDSLSKMNFKLSRWHVKEMMLVCTDMISKINEQIGEEQTTDSDEMTI